MRSERVWFSFFIIMALTLNFGFVYGDIDDPSHHDKIELFLAFVVSIVCTILKFGDRSQLGALLLATSMVADVQLFFAIMVWTFNVGLMDSNTMATIVSLSAGALIANIVSTVIVIIESISFWR